ncbi:CDP-alcohol phosphatidyltransferase family protein [Ahrensia kielensis]|uniref:CDP-diacylglycerol--glycerol-3-phosphate 3-phosphatidyltransferase n=1 Tax=Ahrensia kielensis TaxID=76980 RepID=A0ABU9T366_9HYPH|nr:CDP-alcohol phosphatidyltransferase family protein [Ahrensia kielensis]
MGKNVYTLPNLITLARLFTVPLIIYLIVLGNWTAALVLFVLAGISDAVDGIIARKYGLGSEVGAYLDPISDKVLLTAVFIALGYYEVVPIWFVFLVVARDVLIIGAVVLSTIMGADVDIKPLMISKANTLVQIGLAAYLIATKAGFFSIPILGSALIYIVAALTLASTAAYCVVWFRHMAEYED